MMGSSGGGLDWVVLEPKWNGGGGLSNRHGLFGFWAHVWINLLKKSGLERVGALVMIDAYNPGDEIISKGFGLFWLLEMEQGASCMVFGVNW
jgi:hypothetical protein